MSYIAVNEQRESVIDFSYNMVFDSLGFVSPMPLPKPAWQSVLWPYTPIVWGRKDNSLHDSVIKILVCTLQSIGINFIHVRSKKGCMFILQ